MDLIPGPETRAAVLKHPFVLAGGAVVALLALTAGVLVIIDSARDGTDAAPAVQIEPHDTATPGPISKTAVAIGVSGRTNTTTAVRQAPGTRSRPYGTIQRGTEVTIDGKTDEGNWYRIIFPPNSELHGWVDADSLDVTGNPATLRVATPEPPVIVEVPTNAPPLELTPEEHEPTPEETGTPDGSETPDTGLPDLVIGTTPIVSNGKLFITVINQGAGTFEGDLVVAIFNVDQTALLGGATLPGFVLEPGLSIDVGTGYDVTVNQSLLLVVDPNGEIEELDNTNNQITVAISVGVAPEPTEEDLPEELEDPLAE